MLPEGKMTMDDKILLRNRRSALHPVGWGLAAYYLLMSVGVSAYSIAAHMLMPGNTDVGWGYIFAILVGTGLLVEWKKTEFVKKEVFARGRPMAAKEFFALFALFYGAQYLTAQINTFVETLLNMLGLTMIGAVQSAGQQHGLSMVLYASLVAPLSEEFLFRGFILRHLQLFGKKFAIIGSSVLFAVFHGNLAQLPFAFLIGLVLAYVALEHHIIWAVVLHMFNNMVLVDLIPRLTASAPAVGDAFRGGLILACAVASVVILIVKWKQIGPWLQREKMDSLAMQALLTHPGVILLTVLCLINAILLISPVS